MAGCVVILIGVSIYCRDSVLCSLIPHVSTRPTLTIPLRIPTALSSIARKLLRTLRNTNNTALPHLKLASVLALTPLARKPAAPASTKLRAQFRQAPTLTSTISVLHRKIRFLPRPTFRTYRMRLSSLRSVLSVYTKSAPMRHLISLRPPVTVS